MQKLVFFMIVFFASVCTAQPPAYPPGQPGPWVSNNGSISTDSSVGLGTNVPLGNLEMRAESGFDLVLYFSADDSENLADRWRMGFLDTSLGFNLESVRTGAWTSYVHVSVDGDIGLNTKTPGARLDVKASTNDGSTEAQIWQDSDGTVLGVFDSDGYVGLGVADPDTVLDVSGAVTKRELSADPSDPDEGSSVTWQSDGTGSGDDGDILMKITAGGTTKTTTLVDFSAL